MEKRCYAVLPRPGRVQSEEADRLWETVVDSATPGLVGSTGVFRLAFKRECGDCADDVLRLGDQDLETKTARPERRMMCLDLEIKSRKPRLPGQRGG